MIPLEEFPTTASTNCIIDKYLRRPSEEKATAFRGCLETYFLIKELMTLPPASAFASVKMIFESLISEIAYNNALHCLPAVAFSRVTG